MHFKNAILRSDDPRAKYQIAVMLFDDLLEGEDIKQYENSQVIKEFCITGPEGCILHNARASVVGSRCRFTTRQC